MESRRCDNCNFDVHRATYAEHLGSKKHLEKITHDDMNIAEWLYKEEQRPNKKKIYKCNPKTIKQIARDKISSDDKEIYEELV